MWAIPHDQQSSPAEYSTETASPPSYNHTAPPPPYTAHARLGEVSIHRSYPYEPPLQEDDLISDNDGGGSHIIEGWLEHSGHDNDASSYVEEPVETGESTSLHDNQPAVYPLATSTPSPSLNELQLPLNSVMFVKSLTSSNLPPVKPIPMLRPIRAQNLSAPNLFASYPPPGVATHENDQSLNNTLPRMARLPPLQRKLHYPHHVRSLSDGRLPSSQYCNRTLSHSMSTGECEPISEQLSCEPSSNDTIDNS